MKRIAVVALSALTVLSAPNVATAAQLPSPSSATAISERFEVLPGLHLAEKQNLSEKKETVPPVKSNPIPAPRVDLPAKPGIYTNDGVLVKNVRDVPKGTPLTVIEKPHHDLEDVDTSTRGILKAAGVRKDGTKTETAEGVTTGSQVSYPYVTGLSRHVTPACVGNGTDGRRVQAVYAVEADDTDRFSAVKAALLEETKVVDDVFQASAAQTGGGKKVRWVHDGNCTTSIMKVVVPAGSLSQKSFSATAQALTTAGLDRSDRKYVVFTDNANALPGGGSVCGTANYYADNSPGVDNFNNSGGNIGVTIPACWSRNQQGSSATAHELMHSLGAVLNDTPNATGQGHCTDDADLMCYVDGSAKPMRNVCPEDQEDIFDCNKDDYFNTSPQPGSYLASNWNTANNLFLETVAPLPAAPVADIKPASGKNTFTPGVPFDVQATSDQSTATYSWNLSQSSCTGTEKANNVLTVNCPNTVTNLEITLVADSTGGTQSRTAEAFTGASGPFSVSAVAPNSAPAKTAFNATANVSGGTGPYTYKWTQVDNTCTMTGAASRSVTVNCPASKVGTYWTAGLDVKDASGTTTSDFAQVLITEAPLTITTSGPKTVYENTSATFTGSANTGTNATYTGTWASAKGWISNGANSSKVTVTPANGSAGQTDTLTYTVTTSDNRKESTTVTYTVGAPLTVNLSLPGTATAGEPVVVTATPSRAATVKIVSSAAACTVIMTSATQGELDCDNKFSGDVVVSAKATAEPTSTATGDTAVASKTISYISSTGSLNTEVTGPASMGSGKTVTFNASNKGEGDVTFWEWRVSEESDCRIVGTLGEPTAQLTCPYEFVGNAVVTATGSTADGYYNSKSVSVNVAQAPAKFFVDAPGRIDAGDSSPVTASIVDAATSTPLAATLAITQTQNGYTSQVVGFSWVKNGQVSGRHTPDAGTVNYKVLLKGSGSKASFFQTVDMEKYNLSITAKSQPVTTITVTVADGNNGLPAAGREVVIERLVSGQWTEHARVLTDGNGQASALWKASTRSVKFRGAVYSASGGLFNASRTVLVKVPVSFNRTVVKPVRGGVMYRAHLANPSSANMSGVPVKILKKVGRKWVRVVDRTTNKRGWVAYKSTSGYGTYKAVVKRNANTLIARTLIR